MALVVEQGNEKKSFNLAPTGTLSLVLSLPVRARVPGMEFERWLTAGACTCEHIKDNKLPIWIEWT